jgi:hypothetical protein
MSAIGEKDKVFVLEIGRPIKEDVENFIGKKVDGIISIQRAISELEIPSIVAEAYKKIMELGRGGNVVHLFLSGPIGLIFRLGQAIGFHVKIIVWQFFNGQYVQVPPLTREMLFEVRRNE